VSQTKADQLKLIDVRAPMMRLLLLVPVALALFGSWYAGRWYIGDVIAEYSPNLETGALETAQMTTNLAPDDPLTHWTVAALEKQALPPDRLQETLSEYEKAVSLSPNDYRLWVDLGRTREQAGDVAGGCWATCCCARGVRMRPLLNCVSRARWTRDCARKSSTWPGTSSARTYRR
jgi:hypothetical protein